MKMRGPRCCKIKIIPKFTLLLSLLSLHVLPGIHITEATPPPPIPPRTPPHPSPLYTSEWLNTDEVAITSLSVPMYVGRGEDVELECKWTPQKRIYSVKWYYNDVEFFTYKPEEDPQVVTLPAEGFQVNVNSTGEKIVLHGVKRSASGSYKCEVTMEGPGFVTADKSGEMKVVDIPKDKPRITGMQQLYQAGDHLDLTCSSAPSLPPAALTWYINGRQAPARYITQLAPTHHPGGLTETHKRLSFKVSNQHFRGGAMTLRCEASIKTLYTKTQQHSVDGKLTYETPVLSSREKSAVTGGGGRRGGGGGGGGQLVEMMVVMTAALVVMEVMKRMVLMVPLTTTTTTTTITTPVNSTPR